MDVAKVFYHGGLLHNAIERKVMCDYVHKARLSALLLPKNFLVKYRNKL